MAEEEEEKKISVAEVRKTIAGALTAAFGFVIALVWKDVVLSGLALGGINTSSPGGLDGWAIFMVTAVVLTVFMVVLIIFMSRWGSAKS